MVVGLQSNQKVISFSLATSNDAHSIAALHALSWQRHYKGILSDQYLDKDVFEDRLEVWQRRFEHPSADQYVLLAKDDETICGLACTYLNDDPEYGALLDNLHVLAEWQGQGIGTNLMALTAEWVAKHDPVGSLYLWVFEENYGARTFYDRMKGHVAERDTIENVGGGSATILRYVWPDLQELVQQGSQDHSVD